MGKSLVESCKKMSDPITLEIFNHLVQLAALELAPQEAEYVRRELNNQLKAIQELEAIPLDREATITSHGVAYTEQNSPAPRPDEWIPYPDVNELLAQAPEVEDRYIVVPDIPHTTLE
jgi:aspartyl-tRNA(Asn)/glutamyl-tRNA(Gln) amidotransferase subunit C